MFCSPSHKPNSQNGSCFDKMALSRIANGYNKKYPNSQIQYSRSTPDTQLWNEIRDKMANVCGDNEMCWLDQDFLKGDSQVAGYYKPKKPKGQREWLKTSDINNVLKQFEDKYPDFAFMGAVPMDFSDIFEEFAKIDLCSLYNGNGLLGLYKGKQVRKYGFVFNLDKHNQGGSHWVCMFIDLSSNDPYIGFFDSVGSCPPPKEVSKLMYKLADQAKECLSIRLKLKCNSVQHQKKNTECGMYCIYFINTSLESGKTFEEIVNKIITDDEVNRLRDYFFRPNKN